MPVRTESPLRRLFLAALLSVLGLAACAHQAKDVPPGGLAGNDAGGLVHNAGGEDEADGPGGTGMQAGGDGIGGTGMRAEGDGFGGTGIVGPISGFGSIIVNGVHIHYPSGMLIGLNGQPASTDELKIGRVVEVRAAAADGGLAARHIEVLDAVVGPVEVINEQDGSLRVLGQTVYLDEDTVLASGLDAQGALKAVRPGDLLRVSGLHLENGSVAATRVEPAQPDAAWLVAGPVKDLGPEGFSIGGLRIKRGDARAEGLRNGSPVLVRGRRVEGGFLARKLLVRPDIPFNGMVERLVIQGYPAVVKGARALRIGRLRVEMPADTAAPRTPDANGPGGALARRRIQLTARIDRSGHARAERVIILPRPAGRRPSIPLPRREIQWNRTPRESRPGPPLSERPVEPRRPLPQRPSIRRPMRLDRLRGLDRPLKRPGVLSPR